MRRSLLTFFVLLLGLACFADPQGVGAQLATGSGSGVPPAADPRGGTAQQQSSVTKPEASSSSEAAALSSRAIVSSAAPAGRSSSSRSVNASSASAWLSQPLQASSLSSWKASSPTPSSAPSARSSKSAAASSALRRSSVTTSSQESSAEQRAAPASEATATGFWIRQRFGYDIPIIDPAFVRHPSEVSLSAQALSGNLLLAVLIALTLGTTGVIMRRLVALDEQRVKTILRRLPFQAVLTLILIWIVETLIPEASAQGMAGIESLSPMRIPVYAALFFLVVGTSNYLFNSILTSEGDRLKLFAREQHIGNKAWFIALLIVGYGVIGAHINPEFNLLQGRELGILIVASIALIFSVCFKDSVLYGFARFWKMPGKFRANIGGFAIAVVCIALSRSFALNPGYIYGVPVGLLILSKAYEEREGFFEFLGIAWLLILALVVWILGERLQAYPMLFDLFTLLFVILAEDAFFEMLPLPYLAGGTIFRWSKPVWLCLFIVAVFAVLHTLFNPQGTIMSLQESPPTLAALLLLGSYAVGVFLLWGYVVWKTSDSRR